MCRALLFVIAAAAMAQPAGLSGRYTLQQFREVGSELLLKPDGNFEFMLAYGAADYWAKGTWRVQEQAVILNSTPRAETPPFRLVRSSAQATAAIRVRMQAPNGRAVPNIDVTLLTASGKLKARTDTDGVALFAKEAPARSVAFSVRVYHLDTEPIALNAEHTDFTFEINAQAIAELRFTDERFSINGETLTTYYWGPDQEMRYVKGR
ncbi:MAG: hypothetical protein JWP63_1276 [Candidatus Solibacter sp.]|nr:hypothetical protein [Candidatus Solibacter sp.]